MKFSDVALARRVYGHALTHDFSVWYHGGDDTKLAQIVRFARLRRCSRARQFELRHDFKGARKPNWTIGSLRQTSEIVR
jgi:hypothetical protein